LGDRTVETKIDFTEPALVGRFDFVQTLRILTNLVGNAIQYSPGPSPIELSVEREGETLVFAVADRGPGIPPADRERIFEPFYRPASAVAGSGAGHVGGPFSAMDMLIALYFRIMNIRPEEPRWTERDRFILSKGHSSIGQYVVMALRGFLPIEELKTFDKGGSRLQGHPDVTRLPGLDTSTGSLGQGLSVGLGFALGARMRGQKFHTFVMLGDANCRRGWFGRLCTSHRDTNSEI